MRWRMPLRILLVEDDENIAEAIAESLRLVGIEVVVCETYLAAAEALENLPFDAVVSDGQFPSGIAASTIGPHGIPLLLKAKAKGKAIVLLTGSDELVLDAKALGIPALTKPASREQILEALDRQTAEESFRTQWKRKGNGG